MGRVSNEEMGLIATLVARSLMVFTVVEEFVHLCTDNTDFRLSECGDAVGVREKLCKSTSFLFSAGTLGLLCLIFSVTNALEVIDAFVGDA